MMNIKFENMREFHDSLEEFGRSQITFEVDVRSHTVRIISGELRKETLEWLAKQKVKVSA
jgi:hypothetical protein